MKKAKEQKKLKAGDEAIVNTYGQQGTLLRNDGKGQWRARLGVLKMNVSEEDMMPVTPQKEARPRATTVRSAENNHVGTQLDLRGKHYEEALAKVDQCIDATTLTGYP